MEAYLSIDVRPVSTKFAALNGSDDLIACRGGQCDIWEVIKAGEGE